MKKIVSLIASSTEILGDLGLVEQLKGVSHECDYPPEIVGKPVLTAPKLDIYKSSREIDEQVRNLVRDGLSVYKVDNEKLKEVDPDIIITQDQCEVCAVSLKDVCESVSAVLNKDVEIISLKPDFLGDILQDILTIGKATATEEKAEKLVNSLRERIETIRDKASAAEAKPRFIFIEWIDPVMVGANWIPEMVDIAGGTYAFAESGRHTPTVTWEDIVRFDPEVLLFSPCGFKLNQTFADLPFFTGKPEWKNLSAVKNNRVFVVDGNLYFNRPSQRIVDSLEMMAGMIHPEIFGEISFKENEGLKITLH